MLGLVAVGTHLDWGGNAQTTAPINLREYSVVPGTPLHDLLSKVALEIILRLFITEPPTPMRLRKSCRRTSGQ